MDGLSKAAILISGMDAATADSLISQLDPHEARALRKAMFQLDGVSMPLLERSANDFRIAAQQKKESLPSPVYEKPKPHPVRISLNVDQDTYEGAAEPTIVQYTIPSASQAASAPKDSEKTKKPFDFLHNAEARQLANILKAERPQTIALVMANLPPKLSGELLSIFPALLQAEIVNCLANLEDADESILQEIESVLLERVSATPNLARKRISGLQAIEQILAAAAAPLASEILTNIDTYKPELAKKISFDRIKYEDLADLSDKDLTGVFSRVDRRTALLSLIGAPRRIVQRIIGSLNKEQQQILRKEIIALGIVPESECEEARKIVLRESIKKQ